MGTFNSTLFIVEILATVVFFIVMQSENAAPDSRHTSGKGAAAGDENSEFQKAA